jgi:ACS family glucarate transporter-like MFS transporter
MAATTVPLATRPSRVRYVVLAALCAVAAITYVQRTSLGVFEKELRKEMEFTKLQSAWITSGLFVTYALFQVPGGRLGQLWSCRRAFSLFAVICSGATAVLAVASGFPGLLAARMGIGLGQAGVFPCSTETVKTWFPVARRASANGAVTTSMQIGGIIGPLLAGPLVVAVGWRWTVGLFAIPGLVWAAWFYIWYRDRPDEHGGVNREELQVLSDGRNEPLPDRADVRVEAIPWGTLLTSSTLGWICAQQFFRGAGYMFYQSWFATFLREGRGVEGIVSAGAMSSAPIAATALGSIIGGWLSDWFLIRTGSRWISRQVLAGTTSLAAAVFVLAAYPITSAWPAVIVISLGAFCAAITGPIVYTLTIELGGNHVPTVFGLMNMWGNVGAFAFPFAVPLLVGEENNANWDPVLFLFAAIYLAAAICAVAFDSNKGIFEKKRAD